MQSYNSIVVIDAVKKSAHVVLLRVQSEVPAGTCCRFLRFLNWGWTSTGNFRCAWRSPATAMLLWCWTNIANGDVILSPAIITCGCGWWTSPFPGVLWGFSECLSLCTQSLAHLCSLGGLGQGGEMKHCEEKWRSKG